MYKQLNKLLLLMAVYIAPLTFLSAEAEVKTARPADTIRLQQASDFVGAKQYKHGYVSFKKMAQHGCPYSQCILGIMHQKGRGAKKSAFEARYWFQKSARQGFADAENRLGLMYYHGDGIKKNLVLAKRWLSRAADHGVEEARELLTQIPGETNLSNKLAQAPQQIVGTATNVQKSWQGYSQVVEQLSQLSSVNQPH